MELFENARALQTGGFENASTSFSFERKTFWFNGVFLKRCVISKPCLWFLKHKSVCVASFSNFSGRLSVDGKQLTRFVTENVAFKFLLCRVNGPLDHEAEISLKQGPYSRSCALFKAFIYLFDYLPSVGIKAWYYCGIQEIFQNRVLPEFEFAEGFQRVMLAPSKIWCPDVGSKHQLQL